MRRSLDLLPEAKLPSASTEQPDNPGPNDLDKPGGRSGTRSRTGTDPGGAAEPISHGPGELRARLRRSGRGAPDGVFLTGPAPRPSPRPSAPRRPAPPGRPPGLARPRTSRPAWGASARVPAASLTRGRGSGGAEPEARDSAGPYHPSTPRGGRAGWPSAPPHREARGPSSTRTPQKIARAPQLLTLEGNLKRLPDAGPVRRPTSAPPPTEKHGMVPAAPAGLVDETISKRGEYLKLKNI
ncbi:proline-rich protein 2-like [Ailuropoda melanoleuca]|uniref:proline-rich protein 2-like n=1 Tax=Ailuropoda melanoleuca TaxID=9646 RepID=UPI0014941AED|nr:proline-rich protein 2-like [Ailuropoda melanoleuca]